MTKKCAKEPVKTAPEPPEGYQSDCKSLRQVTGTTTDFAKLAHGCVCFANGSGGESLIGIEEGESTPPAGQRVDPDLFDRVRERVGELTVNVGVLPDLRNERADGAA